MNVYCSKDCEMTGAVCDFCKNYIDYGTHDEFAGTGMCNALQIEVDASGSCSNHFVCMNVKQSN